jgi:hypothetical protein
MTVSTRTIRRTAALTSAAAALALPGAAMAMPAPETGYNLPRGPVSPTVSAPSSGGGGDTTLAVVLASGAFAVALGGVAYSVKLGSTQRRVLRTR